MTPSVTSVESSEHYLGVKYAKFGVFADPASCPNLTFSNSGHASMPFFDFPVFFFTRNYNIFTMIIKLRRH